MSRHESSTTDERNSAETTQCRPRAGIPTRDEVLEARDRELERRGCFRCFVDDADRLSKYQVFEADCPMFGHEVADVVCCEDCSADDIDGRTVHVQQQARRYHELAQFAAIAIYDCGHVESIEDDESVALECNCGARLEDVRHV